MGCAVMLRMGEQDEFQGMRARENIRRFKGESGGLSTWLACFAIVLACAFYALAFSWLRE